MGACQRCKQAIFSENQSPQLSISSTPQFSQEDSQNNNNNHNYTGITYIKNKLYPTSNRKAKSVPEKVHRGIYRHEYCPINGSYRPQIKQTNSKKKKNIFRRQKKKINQLDRRSTKLLQFGSPQRNISFTITSQPVHNFQCQFLLMFSDTLHRVKKNPFIYQLLHTFNMQQKFISNYNRSYYQGKIIHDKILKIVNPFPGIQILNLYVIPIPLFQGTNNDLLMLHQIIADQIFKVPLFSNVVQIGVIELAYNFGIASKDFQSLIVQQLENLSVKAQKSLKVTYWAYDNQNIQQLRSILLQDKNPLSLVHQQSSNYF